MARTQHSETFYAVPVRESRWRALLTSALDRIWYVQSDVTIILNASPDVCVMRLNRAAKPSVRQLHLRDLYRYGRRYHLYAHPGGFRMMTTSRIIWRPSQRSSSAAILVGQFEQLDEQLSRLHLQARIKPFYLLGVVLIPLYFTVFFFYIPWPRAVVIVSLALMYLFSWLNRRYTARLEAFEMVHFIRTVLNDVIPMPAELPAATSQQSGEFEAVWERFYEEHKAD